MNSRNYLKITFVFYFFVAPLICFAQTSSSSINIWQSLLVTATLFVFAGALIALYSMNNILYKAQLKRAGIIEVVPTQTLWERWKEKLTDIVPVEKENDILLSHSYDGIQELDNNLPPWWLYGFYISIIYGFAYIGYYHYSEYGLSSDEEYKQEMEIAQIKVDKYIENQANTIDEANLVALVDANSIQLGKSVFNNNCIACHMKGGGGAPKSIGPNLADEYWLHGGDIKSVFKTVKYGVPKKGMIAWKDQLKPADIHRVSSYILSLQGSNPINPKAPQGEKYVAEASSSKAGE